MSHKQTEGDLSRTWKHYMKKVEKPITSLPMLCISIESHVAPLMKAKQTLRKLHAKQLHSPERIQKRKHKPWISISQNTPLIANKVDATHVFFRYNKIPVAKTNRNRVTLKAQKQTLPSPVADSRKPLLKTPSILGTEEVPILSNSRASLGISVPKHSYWILQVQQPCLETPNSRTSKLFSSHQVLSTGSQRTCKQAPGGSYISLRHWNTWNRKIVYPFWVISAVAEGGVLIYCSTARLNNNLSQSFDFSQDCSVY